MGNPVRLFVSNLPYSLTESELGASFSEWGYAVEEAKIITDRESGKSRGFGFVTVDSRGATVEDVIHDIGERVIGGRKVVVAEPHPRVERGGGGRGARRGGRGAGGRGERGRRGSDRDFWDR